VLSTESGNRSLIGVVLGQRGDNLITAGLYAAKQLVDRLAPTAAPPETPSPSGIAGRLGAGQPRPATPARAYRRHIENHIRPGNAPLP